jgi:hypothetical protein
MRVLIFVASLCMSSAAYAERVVLPTPPAMPIATITVETTGSDPDVHSIVCTVEYIKREDGGITKVRRCTRD